MDVLGSELFFKLGRELQTARTPAKIGQLLTAVNNRPGGHLFPFSVAAINQNVRPREIRNVRRAFQKVSCRLYPLQQDLQEQREVVAEGRQAVGETNSKTKEGKAVRKICKEREARLEQLTSQLAKDRQTSEVLESKLKCLESTFAQREVFEFVKSRRYAFSPENLSAAIAGLPFMGWRHSFRRCKKILADREEHPIEHLNYLVFKAVNRIVKKVSRRSSPRNIVESFRTMIRNLPWEHRLAQAEMAKSWRPLRQSIQQSYAAGFRTADLPYRITDGFVMRLRLPQSAKDRLLTAEEKLEIPRRRKAAANGLPPPFKPRKAGLKSGRPMKRGHSGESQC